VLLVSLDVGSILEPDVLVEIDGRTDDNFPRAEDVGDAVAGGKAVEPKNAQVHELSDHATWQLREREDVVDASGSILDGADLSLSFWHVFASCDRVEGHTRRSGKVTTKDFKLSIHKNKLGNKPTFPVDVADGLDGREQSFFFRSRMSLAVQNLIFRDMVTINGSLLTNISSAPTMTSW
jgi:hypothetical protein